MKYEGQKIVLANGVRTPWGHVNSALADFRANDLAELTIREVLKRSHLKSDQIDGVIFGWVGQGSHAPNIARIAGVKAGLSVKTLAYTLHVNCVSGIETIASAVRHMLAGEGDVFIAGGTESMSNFPYVIRGARQYKGLRNLGDVRNHWDQILNDPHIELGDSMIEGIRDPICNMIMAETAEALAQIYSISREEQDQYAMQSYQKSIQAIEAGKFNDYVFPIYKEDQLILEKDENPFLRLKFIEKPALIAKSPYLFQNSQYSFEEFYQKNIQYLQGKTYDKDKTFPTVTPFNSCPMTDGSAAVIVTTEAKAKELGLDIIAVVEGWGFSGVEPEYMAMGPAHSVQVALKRTGFEFNQMHDIELHEAFAAGCLAIFKVGYESYQHDWAQAYEQGIVNPTGGSLSMGHPLAASGTRLLLNLAYEMKQNPQKERGVVAACAAGGIAGSMVLSRYD